MKKLYSKFIFAIMIFIMAFSSTACTSESKKGEIQMEDPINPVTPVMTPWEEELDTLHDINVTQGTKDFIVNGKTEYVIVIPENPLNAETTYAADELKYFLGNATGVDINVVSDKDLSYDANKKYISLGDTTLVTSAGITVDKKTLTRSGFQILSKGNSVFLIGGGDFGTLYAAYEFLTHEIGFEVYSQDEIYYTVTPSLKLHEFNVTDVPDFTYRMRTSRWQTSNTEAGRRMRINQEGASGKVWMGPGTGGGQIWHNSFVYISPDKWKEKHPLWFSEDGQQLCYNAHGDEQEFILFFQEFMKGFIAALEANPNCENITITQADVDVWCNCAVCKAENTKYGTDAATMIKFCNKVSVALEEYFKENNIERTINICFFAYHKTEEAPVIKDESGKYIPIDDSVVCRDNVYCLYAPIGADYLRDFYHKNNITRYETLDKWCVLSPHIYLWIYSTEFKDYLSPYNSLNQMQENYIFAKSRNVSYIFDQMQYDNEVATDWGYLKTYLQSKLQWDVKADKRQLIDNFMDNFYKDAAEPMQKALALYNTWFEYLKTEKNIDGHLFNPINPVEYFPKGIIDTMLGYFDEAYAAIEPLKASDPVTYEKIYDRICLETLVYRKMNIEAYFTYYSNSELLELKRSFKEDAIRIGVTNRKEGVSISELWKTWGIE